MGVKARQRLCRFRARCAPRAGALSLHISERILFPRCLVHRRTRL